MITVIEAQYDGRMPKAMNLPARAVRALWHAAAPGACAAVNEAAS